MKICVPIDEDKGLESQICAHFGSAPEFLIVDLESGDCHAVRNGNPHHSHGMCNPMASLDGEGVDAVVVGGIGLGALRKLRAAKVDVFLADHPVVKQVVDAHAAGALRRVTSELACGQHGRGPHGRGRGDCHGARTGMGRGGGHGFGQGRGRSTRGRTDRSRD